MHITCPCGETINLSTVPNPQGFKVIVEPLLDELITALVKAFDATSTARDFEMMVYKTFRTPGIAQAYECPKCGRLALLGRASERIPALWFRREKQRDEGLTLTSLVAETAAAM
jgi:hypothetical protein